MYIPQEDSYLLEESVKKYGFGKVLDVGTGSGIQGIAASKKKNVNSVLAVDISERDLLEAKKNAELNKVKIKFAKSNLFNNIKGSFDTIIFNPPYLPLAKGESKDEGRALSGGKKGYELLVKFLSEANEYLAKDGIILILFSSLTHKAVVDEAIEDYGFESTQLAKKRISFENLFVYKLQKNWVLKEVYKKVKNIKKLAKGHRGLIYTGSMNNKKVTIKAQRKDIDAKETVNRESKWLKILNKKGIGPKLISSGDNYFIYEYVSGIFIKEYLETKKNVNPVLVKILKKCFILDNLGINKEEMTNPYKHIIINKKITLLDFERASYTEKPQNVTQFCQYILKYTKLSRKKMIELTRGYRKNMSEANFNRIVNFVSKQQ
ncbi:HemK2/MTQ2 family protein methyltransferase [Nanoarchaeota archaeon]